MKKPFKIGQKEYKFKKDAITHYRTILNSYDFGQSLNDSDFDDLIDLLDLRKISALLCIINVSCVCYYFGLYRRSDLLFKAQETVQTFRYRPSCAT